MYIWSVCLKVRPPRPRSLLIIWRWSSLPKQRQHWSLGSVPYIRFICFPVGDGLVPSFIFLPSKIHPGSLLCKNSRLLSLFVLSASSPPVSVYSADLLQCRFPTSSVPHRPSVGKLPTLRLRSTNVFPWFPSQASHMQVCTPPPPTCAAGGTWLGCGGRGVLSYKSVL